MFLLNVLVYCLFYLELFTPKILISIYVNLYEQKSQKVEKGVKSWNITKIFLQNNDNCRKKSAKHTSVQFIWIII